jgi:hypothetical protein
MIVAYEQVRPRPKTLAYFGMINKVLDDIFVRQGYRLSVRQLFYQLVAQGLIKNSKPNYDFLTRQVRDGRMRGYVDWEAIEDRLREVDIPADFVSVESALTMLSKAYRLDRQGRQEYRIEIWAEKDAVSQIIEPRADELGIPFLIGRGQFSVSCLKEAADRWLADGRPVKVLYFGDHDPSGILSIEKNVRETMGVMCPEVEQEIVRVAVPIGKLGILRKLPPNPVKEADRNTAKYRALYGEECWELEALSPAQLTDLLNQALKQVMDEEEYDQVLHLERLGRKRLNGLVKQ